MISIIIPVYNVDQYLERCVESVLAQELPEYEIILVDDGSTDRSGEICDDYEKQNTHIITIHKSNEGLSSARNIGIEKSRGQYIFLLDSDDWINKGCLSAMQAVVDDYAPDMVIGSLEIVGDYSVDAIPFSSYNVICKSGMETLISILRGRSKQGSSACGMLIRKDLLSKHQFPFGRYHEDDFTTFKYYQDAKRVAIVDFTTYFYLQRHNSIMHRAFGKSEIDELDAADYLYTECAKMGPRYRRAALVKKHFNYCQVFWNNPDLEQIDYNTFLRILSFFDSAKNLILFNPYIGKKDKLFELFFVFGGVKLLKKVYAWIEEKNA